jgi:hypothetical protein
MSISHIGKKNIIRKKISEETRKKMRDAKIGYIPWNKGLKYSSKNKKNKDQLDLFL